MGVCKGTRLHLGHHSASKNINYTIYSSESDSGVEEPYYQKLHERNEEGQQHDHTYEGLQNCTIVCLGVRALALHLARDEGTLALDVCVGGHAANSRHAELARAQAIHALAAAVQHFAGHVGGAWVGFLELAVNGLGKPLSASASLGPAGRVVCTEATAVTDTFAALGERRARSCATSVPWPSNTATNRSKRCHTNGSGATKQKVWKEAKVAQHGRRWRGWWGYRGSRTLAVAEVPLAALPRAGSLLLRACGCSRRAEGASSL